MEKDHFFPVTMSDPIMVLKTFNYEYKKNKDDRRVSKKDKVGREIAEEVLIHETTANPEMTAVAIITMAQATGDNVSKLNGKVYDAQCC